MLIDPLKESASVWHTLIFWQPAHQTYTLLKRLETGFNFF